MANLASKRSVHQFKAMPGPARRRSAIPLDCDHLTTMLAGRLTPIYCEEVIPGDTFSMKCTSFVRIQTLIRPIMENQWLHTYFFFVPMRLVWENWEDFFTNEASKTVPVVSFTNQATETPIDHFGLPVKVANALEANALPLRCYNLIYNEWFMQQDVMDEATENIDDGPDAASDFPMRFVRKMRDYFTSARPWPQDAGTGSAVTLPLGTVAPVLGNGYALGLTDGSQYGHIYSQPAGETSFTDHDVGFSVEASMLGLGAAVANTNLTNSDDAIGVTTDYTKSGIYADLSNATAATVNDLREAIAVQRILEIDARCGSRYAEVVLAYYGVKSSDARLNRSEYLGGDRQRIGIMQVPQTSETNTTDQGDLAGIGVGAGYNGSFIKSFEEHGYIIGLATIKTEQRYQQGMHAKWNVETRYDFFIPEMEFLGEVPIYSKELYADGTSNDDDVFGYQEQGGRYKYGHSLVTGLMRSNATGTMEAYHLAQDYASRPTLGQTFLRDNPDMPRVLAYAEGHHYNADFHFRVTAVRPMAKYAIPGLPRL